MKISTCTGLYQDHYAEKELFAALSKIGYTALDYNFDEKYAVPRAMFYDGSFRQKCRETKKIADANGLEIVQTHATYCTDFLQRGSFGKEEADSFSREIEAAAILGAKYIIIHPIKTGLYDKTREKDHKLNLKMYESLRPALKEFGVKVAIENMFEYDPFRRRLGYCECSYAKDLNLYIDELGDEQYGICLDIGHSNLVMQPPGDEVRKLKGRLSALHIHDNNGLEDYHYPPFYGTIDWSDFMSALKETGYSGTFNLEVSPPPSLPPALYINYLSDTYKRAKYLTVMITQ